MTAPTDAQLAAKTNPTNIENNAFIIFSYA